MTKMRVALTIDDLPEWPHGDYLDGWTGESITSSLIASMKKYGLKGVYSFSNSWPLVERPELSKLFDMWVEAGHHIANHTHTHKTSHDLSAEDYISDIDLCEEHLGKYISQAPGKYFRYTFNRWGDTEEKVVKIKKHIDAKGYGIGEVTSWFYEWEWDKAYKRCAEQNDQEGMQFLIDSFIDFSIAQLKFDTEEGIKWHGRPFNGVILGHIIPFMAIVADRMFERFLDEGVEFISLEEAINDPINEGAGTFVTDHFLPAWRKSAYSQGQELETIVPEFKDVYARIQDMAADSTAGSAELAPDRPFV